jgi:hypothetical protein
MKNLIPLIILAFLISACGNGGSGTANLEFMEAEEEMIPISRQSNFAPPMPLPGLQKQETQKKKIIKDGRMGLRVKNLNSTKRRVDSLLVRFNAYYENENFNNNDRESSYNLKIRVPSAKFEVFVNQIGEGEGQILYKSIDARDVTDQFIDLETRLKNKKAYLKQYADLLKRANKIKEILEIQEKIRVLEEEIESTIGRLKYLSDQVDYSTLDLYINQQKEYKHQPQERDSFFEQFKQSLSNGWFGFVDFMLYMVSIWPFWLIIGLLIYFLRKLNKRRKKRQLEKKEE